MKKLCYSYRAHEYTPPVAWDDLNKLAYMKQHDDTHEIKQYESFRSVIEMCETSSIIFAVMCSANINMSMKILKREGKITESGTYEDGTYFKLTDDHRTLVDKMVEEIYLSTRFLPLASNKLHSASK